jgi:hypothetical protein
MSTEVHDLDNRDRGVLMYVLVNELGIYTVPTIVQAEQMIIDFVHLQSEEQTERWLSTPISTRNCWTHLQTIMHPR